MLHSIQFTLGELLPRLEELRDRGIISAKDSFTVVETSGGILLEQFSLKDVVKSAFAGDAEALMTNGRFLQAKFSEKAAFRP